jgi:Spy/CpxP family protein refolding chaperone
MEALKILTLALLFISLAMTPTLAKTQAAGPSHDHTGKGTGRFAKIQQSLGLTTQQQNDIQALIAESKQDMVARREATRANREELRALFDAEVLDEARLQQLLQKQAELKAQKIISQHATRTRIRQILTTEQQEKWAELRQKYRDNRWHGQRPQPAESNGGR